MRLRSLLALLALLSFTGVACSGDGGAATTAATAAPGGSREPSNAATPALTGRVSVFAATSLTDVLRLVGAAFTRAHRGVSVEFNFASSSALETQIEQAAPADVFASADGANMQRAVDHGLIEGAPVDFVRNLPVLIVPAENRAKITAPKDLANPGVKLVLAAPEVPIGHYARQIIDRLARDPAYGSAYRDAALRNVVSNESNVRAVLTKVELGEADAGIVYQTDALASGGTVSTIPIPDTANVIATYPIGVVKASRNREAAAAFVAFVRGAEAQHLFKAAGFDVAP